MYYREYFGNYNTMYRQQNIIFFETTLVTSLFLKPDSSFKEQSSFKGTYHNYTWLNESFPGNRRFYIIAEERSR